MIYCNTFDEWITQMDHLGTEPVCVRESAFTLVNYIWQMYGATSIILSFMGHTKEKFCDTFSILSIQSEACGSIIPGPRLAEVIVAKWHKGRPTDEELDDIIRGIFALHREYATSAFPEKHLLIWDERSVFE